MFFQDEVMLNMLCPSNDNPLGITNNNTGSNGGFVVMDTKGTHGLICGFQPVVKEVVSDIEQHACGWLTSLVSFGIVRVFVVCAEH